MIRRTRGSRPALSLAMALLTLLLVGCAAPSTATSVSAPEPSTQAPDELPPPSQAPPMGGPLPAERVPSPVLVDRTCQVDADCAVKNVGHCCGAMPACVHKDSPTDPAAVQAECVRKGMASTCGFREVSACTCSAGRCEAAPEGAVAR